MATNTPTELPLTPELREQVRAAANALVLERLDRGTVVGHTSTGRVMSVRGEAGPAEARWNELAAQLGLA